MNELIDALFASIALVSLTTWGSLAALEYLHNRRTH